MAICCQPGLLLCVADAAVVLTYFGYSFPLNAVPEGVRWYADMSANRFTPVFWRQLDWNYSRITVELMCPQNGSAGSIWVKGLVLTRQGVLWLSTLYFSVGSSLTAVVNGCPWRLSLTGFLDGFPWRLSLTASRQGARRAVNRHVSSSTYRITLI